MHHITPSFGSLADKRLVAQRISYRQIHDDQREKVFALDDDITVQREGLAAAAEDVPRIFLIETEYAVAMRSAEAEWVRGLLAELTTGTLIQDPIVGVSRHDTRIVGDDIQVRLTD